MRSLWGAGVLVFVVACSSSESPPTDAGAEAARTCVPNVVVDCACAGFTGTTICTAAGQPGGCDCSRPTDSGPEPCATPTTWYLDKDGDGHGTAAGTPVSACTQPTGYAASSDDCDDGDARAFPGQTAFFDTPLPDGTFDFDCDKVETPRDTKVGQTLCNFSGSACIGAGTSDYWYNASIPPACGVTGQWMLLCSGTCGSMLEARKQACR